MWSLLPVSGLCRRVAVADTFRAKKYGLFTVFQFRKFAMKLVGTRFVWL